MSILDLDTKIYIPIFADGLRLVGNDGELAEQGLRDLLKTHGPGGILRTNVASSPWP